MQLRIPPELTRITKVVTPITGIDKAPDVEHHDPSNIIRYDDRYYVWFTEHLSVHLGNDGFRDTYIKVATSTDGFHWQVKGLALDKGKPDGPDARGVLTCYIVPADGRWYMFHLAVGPDFSDPQKDKRGLWVAEAETPDGPWRKHLDAPILWPGEDGEWDELCCDDPNLIFRDGKWCLYYKGRRKAGHPMDSFIGLATADSIAGPYTKHPANPLMTGHAASVWIHRKGVAAIGGEVDTPDNSCVRWSEDGIHFVEAGVFPSKSTGFYCPANFNTGPDAGTNNYGVTWGFDVIRNAIPRYIYRFDCSMQISEES